MRTKFQLPIGQAAWLPACVPCNNFGKPYGLIYGFGINISSGFDLPNITKASCNLGPTNTLLKGALLNGWVLGLLGILSVNDFLGSSVIILAKLLQCSIVKELKKIYFQQFSSK